MGWESLGVNGVGGGNECQWGALIGMRKGWWVSMEMESLGVSGVGGSGGDVVGCQWGGGVTECHWGVLMGPRGRGVGSQWGVPMGMG